jgi:hypothetical protein
MDECPSSRAAALAGDSLQPVVAIVAIVAVSILAVLFMVVLLSMMALIAVACYIGYKIFIEVGHHKIQTPHQQVQQQKQQQQQEQQQQHYYHQPVQPEQHLPHNPSAVMPMWLSHGHHGHPGTQSFAMNTPVTETITRDQGPLESAGREVAHSNPISSETQQDPSKHSASNRDSPTSFYNKIERNLDNMVDRRVSLNSPLGADGRPTSVSSLEDRRLISSMTKQEVIEVLLQKNSESRTNRSDAQSKQTSSDLRSGAVSNQSVEPDEGDSLSGR